MSDKNDIVIINLDRPRTLWFGHRALKTLSALTGKGLESFTDMNDFNFEDIEKVMYCGLLTDAKRNNETLTLEDIEDLLDYAPFAEIMDCMQKAFEASFGSDEGEQIKNENRIAAAKGKKK